MDICVARQPILGTDQEISAYELLYRDATGRMNGEVSGEAMTARVMVNTFLSMGVSEVTRGRPAFINFTRDMILGGFASLLPPEQVVIEVLENIEADDEIVAACAKLRDEGYSLAMDDLSELPPARRPLLDLADVFKVDFFLAPERLQASLPSKLAGNGNRFVAEKVETAEVFERAKEWGYDLFQGYFFSKPQLVSGTDVPAHKMNYLRLLQQAQAPDLDFDELEGIVKADASLPYRLLKLINSPYFGWRRRIDSIRHALVAVGQREFRKWVTLLCLTGLGDDRPRELLVQTVVRAHLCEGLAHSMGLSGRGDEAFLVGLFSLFDAIVGRPLAEVLENIPITDDARRALVERDGPLADLLEAAVYYEQGDWDRLHAGIRAIGLSEEAIGEVYATAIKTSDQLFTLI